MEKIVVLGLGYVGLPVAVGLAKKFDHVTGFDISKKRVADLKKGNDWTGEISDREMAATKLKVSDNPDVLCDANFIIVTVPTPIDADNRPDLSPIRDACALIGPRIRKGTVIVFESTVYPGVTDDICAPIISRLSKLDRGKDFSLGYSPERINPGDKVNTLSSIVKIISADDDATLDRLRNVYGSIVEAGLHVAPSIKVAEAAKVIENTQRDINIALINEIALIFDRMGIKTSDVLEAAGTKWNFLPFRPGLVGGHCIGVDPYYLTSAAQKLGYNPEIILAGRRINDDMGAMIGQKAVKLMVRQDFTVRQCKVGILGLTFKEDVPDLRNSKVPDIVSELRDYGIQPLIHDPHANPEEAMDEYGLQLCGIEEFKDLDCLIYAVPHRSINLSPSSVMSMVRKGGVIVDIKSRLADNRFDDRIYWCL
ncbi:UDP-N-acetyl-D-galactosamine dehydrogenase [Parasphingorhabdus marina DSM 22363]|uniref:UDP-N-acetyl-D-galactosamine dehydrogenase n=1 Tax=Parasphingorhabdus marina DSM 22363 TaxID=1123272 RepID=A0A1N6HQ08_9SPHN|nr:nucleotide sugar dehydrogenase [Parasphingorhabdus marina]SIO21843.1 UDP-N-acetyl-D-galactosamine dehydrogenase [Parasphingorhabdus marina DSM 22363]